jgi:hypothetical protein
MLAKGHGFYNVCLHSLSLLKHERLHRSYNPGEKARQSLFQLSADAPTARRFYFTQPAMLLLYIIVTIPNMLMHLQLQATRRHPPRRFVSFSLDLGLRPQARFPSFPALTSTSRTSNDWHTLSRGTSLAPTRILTMTSNIG